MLVARPRFAIAAATVSFGALGVFGDGFVARAAPLVIAPGEAMDVTADHFDIDVEHGTATLKGNVVARVGELEVHCPAVELTYDDSPRVKWARARGGVSLRWKGVEATAPAADLDAKGRSVTLSGGVRLARGRGWVTAQQATLDIASGKVSLQEVKGSIPVDSVPR